MNSFNLRKYSEISFVALMLILFGCTNKYVGSTESITFAWNQQNLLNNEYIIKNIRESEFSLFYLGSKKKRIELDYDNKYNYRKIYNYLFQNHFENEESLISYLKNKDWAGIDPDLKIIIDTSSIIHPKLEYGFEMELGGEDLKRIASYPVIIENIGNEPLRIIEDDKINLNISFDVKNSNGCFEPVIIANSVFCGTGIQHFPLFPEEILVTSIPIVKGNFKSVGRIRYKNVYSNEIPIWIDSTHFKINITDCIFN